jgi:type II secretory pathway component PulF
MRVSVLLNERSSLSNALEQTPDLLSDEQVLAVKLGSESGTLPQTYQNLLRYEAPKCDGVNDRWNTTVIYWVVVIGKLSLIALGYIYFILPTMFRLIQEFGMTQPPSQAYLRAFVGVVQGWFGWFGLAAVLFVFLYFFTHLGLWVRRQARRYLFRPFTGSGRSTLLRVLATSLGAGRPMASSLNSLAQMHYDPWMRRLLGRAAKQVEQGHDAWDSLASVRLFERTESRALAALPSNHVRSWALLRMAERIDVRARGRFGILLTIINPLVILLFGGLVLWFSVSLFEPLSELVHSVAK